MSYPPDSSHRESSVPATRRELFQRLFSPEGRKTFLLGCNRYAESVARVIPVTGYVDDFTSAREFAGKPIVRAETLPRDCLFVSCVVEARPLTALARLRRAGFTQVLDYFTLLRLAPTMFAPIAHSALNLSDITANQEKYRWIDGRLADETSREVLRKVTRFRLTWDLAAMEGFSVDFRHQYFEDFVRLGAGEVFVDGGGYDGCTTLAFAGLCPEYRRVYYFEPSPAMLDASRKKLAHLRDIAFVPKGLFSHSDRLRFDADAGSASRITDQGGDEIEVVRLDDEVAEAVTYVKLDLEGAEYAAIAGAREQIRASRPKLAVSVYHDQRDFWRIPEAILEIDPSYGVYLRHYTEGPLETVMYFV